MAKFETLDAGVEKIKVILNALDNSKFLKARSEYRIFCAALCELNDDNKELAEALNFELGKNDTAINEMLRKCEEIDTALDITSAPVTDGPWTFGSECDGVTTHYHLEDDGHLSLHVKGILTDLPLFEQLIAIYEIGLYSTWVPFCSESHLLKQINFTEFLAAVQMYTPFGISRDVVVHAFGANCLQEKDKIIIVTKSVEEFAGADIPRVSGGFFNGRCDVKHMYAVTELLSPNSAQFTCVMRMDPKFRIPQTIMSWFIKQLVGVVLPLLKKQAKFISNNPEDCEHTAQINANAELYLNFLLPEFRAYIQSKGWQQPTIGGLGVTGTPVDGANYSSPLYQALSPFPSLPALGSFLPLTPTDAISSQSEPSKVRSESCSLPPPFPHSISTTSSFASAADGVDHRSVVAHIMHRRPSSAGASSSGSVGKGRSVSVDSAISSVLSFYSCCEEPLSTAPEGAMGTAGDDGNGERDQIWEMSTTRGKTDDVGVGDSLLSVIYPSAVSRNSLLNNSSHHQQSEKEDQGTLPLLSSMHQHIEDHFSDDESAGSVDSREAVSYEHRGGSCFSCCCRFLSCC